VTESSPLWCGVFDFNDISAVLTRILGSVLAQLGDTSTSRYTGNINQLRYNAGVLSILDHTATPSRKKDEAFSD